MKKLLKLLNEYDPGNMQITRIEGQTIDLIISKRFGFIKWLVENEKVKKQRNIEEYNVYSQEELLLMSLAIDEEPIKLLISNLK